MCVNPHRTVFTKHPIISEDFRYSTHKAVVLNIFVAMDGMIYVVGKAHTITHAHDCLILIVGEGWLEKNQPQLSSTAL